MQILLAGDAHGNHGYINSIVTRANNAGITKVFVLGDFGYWEHTHDGVEFLDDADRYARLKNVMVYFLDGNHDKTGLLLEKYHDRDDEGFIIVRPWIRYAPRGHRWTWNNTRFAAFGGAYSVDKAWRLEQERKRALAIERKNAFRPPNNQLSLDTSGTLWFPEEEMTDEDMTRFLTEDRAPVDIILAHDKPMASIPDWNRKNYEECWPNQNRLQRAVVALKPKFFFHGHLHYYYEDEIRSGDDDTFTKVIGLDCDDTNDRSKSLYVLSLPLTV